MTTFVEDHDCNVYYSHDNSTFVEFTAVVEGFTTKHGYLAERGTITINCTEYPSGLIENDYLVANIDGGLVFNGKVTKPGLHYFGNSVVIEGEGYGSVLAQKWGGEGTDPELDALKNRVYTSQTDGAIKTNFFEAGGGDVSLHDIQDSGLVLATIFPITLMVGQAPWQLTREIDIIIGYWTAETNNGAVTSRPLAVGTADFTAVEGVNIIRADRTPLGTESIINRYIVYGFDYEGGLVGGVGVGDYALPNSNIPTPPTSYTATIRDAKIESDVQALATATLQVGLHNFPYDQTDLVLLGDPTITIGQTAEITSTELDHASDLRFVADVSHHYGDGIGYETTIMCIRTE